MELANFLNNNSPRAAEYEAAYQHLSNNCHQRCFQGPTLQESDGHLNYAFMGNSGGFEGSNDIGLECVDGHGPGLNSSSDTTNVDYYSNAAKSYSCGKSFMDIFDYDQHADKRQTNSFILLHHPTSGKLHHFCCNQD
jgi:hypothetical protein